MKTYAVPLFAVINANDDAQAAQAKQVIDSLLKNDIVKMMLASNGVQLVSTAVSDPYECQPPQPQATLQQPQYAPPNGNNGRPYGR
jgi:hypothetical protein